MFDTRSSSGKRGIGTEAEDAVLSITLPRYHEDDLQTAIAPPEKNIPAMREALT